MSRTLPKPIFLPSVVMTPAARQAPLLVAAVVLTVGLLISAVLARWQSSRNAVFVDQQTAAQLEHLVEELPRRIQSYEKGVRGARGAILVGGQAHISRATFLIYTHSRDIDAEFPGANGFGFIRRLSAENEANFLAEARATIDPHFAIRPSTAAGAERDVVTLIEPSDRNLAAWGWDVATDERTQAAARDALRSGHAVLTAPLSSASATPAPVDLLLLLPAYDPALPATSADQRELAAFGWAYVALHAQQVLTGLNVDLDKFTLQIQDVTADAAAEPFFTSRRLNADLRPLGIHRQSVILYGRRWQLSLQPTSVLAASLHLASPRQVFLFGGLVSLLLGALAVALLMLSRNRSASHRSQELLAGIAANSTDSIIVESIDSVVISWNSEAARTFGYSAEEAIGRRLQDLILPPDLIQEDLDLLARSAGASRVKPFDTVRMRRDRSLIDVSIAAVSIVGTDGHVTAIATTLRDISARKAAEKVLQNSNLALENQISQRSGELQSVQRDLTTILDAMPSMIGYWDKNLVNRIANRAYCRFFNREIGTMPGLHLREVIGDELFEQGRANVEAALRGTPVSYERRVSDPRGSSIGYVLIHMLPDIVDREVLGFYVLAHDITERKEAELKLRASESLLARTGAMAGVGGWELDLLSNRLTWSEETKRLHDVAGDYLPQLEQAVQFYTPAAQVQIAQCVRDCIEQRKPYDLELELISAKGRRFWARATGAAEVHEDKVVKLVGVFQDITERRHAAQKLTQMSSLLTTVLESSSEVALIATDQDLNISVFNVGAERLLGYASDEVVGRATPAMFHDPGEVHRRGEALSKRLGRKIEGKAVFTEPTTLRQPSEWTFLRKGGDPFPASLVVTPMHGRDGDLLGYLGVAQDITRQVQYEQTLRAAMSRAEKANSAKSEFLANMSHEIRTPLNAIIGLGYLLDQTTLSDDQRQFLNKIQFAGRALLGVINNVLDLSKIEAGEMQLEEEPFDLPDMVREVGQMLSPQALAKGIQLVLQPTPALPRRVKGDASRLRQILTNLLSNAIKFTEAGHVELKLFCTENNAERVRLRCEVEDTGIGIAPPALERIFTPFTQADTSTTRRFGGTGLGLSIARRFVELMGGEIGVTSTVGVGTTFWAEIPLQTAQPGELALADGPRALRILVADINGDAPDGVGAMVRALGLSTQVTDSEELLLDVFGMSHPADWPDVVILPTLLQTTDATQLKQRIALRCAGGESPPMILIDDPTESGSWPLVEAKDTLLLRPVSSSTLFNAINSAVSRRYGYDRVIKNVSFADRNAQWLTGVRVLVADDSDINLEVAKRILQSQGATVSTCLDGQAAFEHVRDHHAELDLVLMDVQMPILDGNEAARRIRHDLGISALPIVALTAGALVAERQRSIEAGMNDFITKPFEPLGLIRKVRHLVEQARGEPIRMVIVAGEAAGQQPGTPLMPSIDAATVRQMFGDDLSLFRSLLTRMLRDFADLSVPAALLREDEDCLARMQARTHKLKGSAGLVGATGVMRLAGAAEEAFRERRPVEVMEEILRKLAAALSTLGEEARTAFQQHSLTDRVPGTAAPPPALTDADLDELKVLLESQNLAAIDKFTELSSPLKTQIGSQAFEHLRLAVDDLDFPLGAQLLHKALAR